MKFFFLLFLLISCSEKNSNYFPLDKIKSWTYAVQIIPEVESKILYKKTNTSIGEKKIKIQNQEKKIFPILREDGTTFFYEITDKGIFRKGVRYLKNKEINFEESRLVLPSSIKLQLISRSTTKLCLLMKLLKHPQAFLMTV